jgi:ABC-2 type transport system permease protein
MSAIASPRLAPLHRVLPGSMWSREWLVTLGRPRALALRVAVPLLLAVPLVAGGAPTFWAAMLLTVLCAMVGAVGSGMTLARARTSGLVARLAATPRPPERAVTSWVLASVAIDAVQLLPALAVVAIAGGVPEWWPALAVAAIAALLVANVLGCALAIAAGGPAEVLLDVAVVLAPLLYLAGLFTGVPREGWRAVVATADPFSHLQAALVGTLGGDPAHSPGAALAVAAAWIAASVAALVPLSRALVRRA